MAWLGASCAATTDRADSQRLEGQDLKGYCQELIQALAQLNEEKAWLLAKSSNPNAPAEHLARGKELLSTAIALIPVLTQKTPAYRQQEVLAPTGNGFVTVIEEWRGAKGSSFYLGCLMDTKYDGETGVQFSMNSDLSRIRESLARGMRSRSAGRPANI